MGNHSAVGNPHRVVGADCTAGSHPEAREVDKAGHTVVHTAGAVEDRLHTAAACLDPEGGSLAVEDRQGIPLHPLVEQNPCYHHQALGSREVVLPC